MPGHPLFLREVRAFEKTIGGRRFAFLHGHESDPYCRDLNPGTGEITAIISGMLEDRNRGPFTASPCHGRPVRRHAGSGLDPLADLTFQHGRMDEMLDGVEAYRKEAGADVVVYGHTHEPGCIGDYHFNTGCWARTNDTFVRIEDDGQTAVWEWLPSNRPACFPMRCDEADWSNTRRTPSRRRRIYYDAAFNCRGEFTLQSVRELADSIAQAGRLICPVAVQPWTERAWLRLPADRRPPPLPGRDCLPEVDRDTGLHLRGIERP